ncbi:MAG: dienelactone hydrolase [Caulobacteraceae bacterium]|nr:dienelactone hydrolase [Caulobacteraceae bacterium]
MAKAANVGFQELKIANGEDPPLTVGVWYPTDAAARPTRLQPFMQTVAPGGAVAGSGLPLVVFSHGTGGWYGGHYDTALALARAGFVVAAVSHAGDTYDDHSRAAMIWARSAQMHRLIDYMLGEWPDHARIDPDRVGAFGFSAGGFTTLVVAGGVPSLERTQAQCQTHPAYFECGVAKSLPNRDAVIAGLPDSVWVHDARVKAAVVAAPALGYTFGKDGLRNVRIPIQLWRDEDDHVLRNPDYAEAVRIALPDAPEYHVVPNADHYDFLAPCSPLMAAHAPPEICAERPGFDRTAFHDAFDAQVVQFFERTLG